MPPKKASSSIAKSANMTPEDPEEPRVLLKDVVPKVEQLQETMGAFQEEMTLFNARHESFAEEIARQRMDFERQWQKMDARDEEIEKSQEKADQRHREAALALEVATQFS